VNTDPDFKAKPEDISKAEAEALVSVLFGMRPGDKKPFICGFSQTVPENVEFWTNVRSKVQQLSSPASLKKRTVAGLSQFYRTILEPGCKYISVEMKGELLALR
jgi:hypothetical protein